MEKIWNIYYVTETIGLPFVRNQSYTYLFPPKHRMAISNFNSKRIIDQVENESMVKYSYTIRV